MEREELIKIAEQLINNGCSEELKAALVREYPELTKSEDEKTLDILVANLKKAEFEGDYISYIYEWIKGFFTLHTKSGWTPSEVQMKALNNARISADISDFEALDSLYSNLSKLTA